MDPGPSGAAVGSQRPWLEAEGLMHPKFCALRLQEPSGCLPRLERYAASPAGAVVPEAWEGLLRCTEEERQLCRKLRERVAGTPGPKDPATMLRFLHARKRRLDAAASMYAKAMQWRWDEARGLERAFRLGSIDDAPHRSLDSFWPPAAVLGRDREGDPVYWIRFGVVATDFLAKAPMEFLVRHEVYTITRILQALEEESRRQGRPVVYMTVVADLAQLGLRHCNFRAMAKYKTCVRVLEDHFPEMVKRIIVIRVPRVASRIWGVAKTFFDEGTKAKIQLVDDARKHEVLAQFIDDKWIPRALGGLNHVGGHPYCWPAIPEPDGPPPEELLEAMRQAVRQS